MFLFDTHVICKLYIDCMYMFNVVERESMYVHVTVCDGVCDGVCVCVCNTWLNSTYVKPLKVNT